MHPPVDVRPATADESLLVAALMLQHARSRGAEIPAGHLDTVARAWHEQRLTRPAWIAESGGQHVGLLVATVVTDLPRPTALTSPRRVLVDTVHETPGSGAADVLRAALATWCRSRGALLVECEHVTPVASHA